MGKVEIRYCKYIERGHGWIDGVMTFDHCSLGCDKYMPGAPPCPYDAGTEGNGKMSCKDMLITCENAWIDPSLF